MNTSLLAAASWKNRLQQTDESGKLTAREEEPSPNRRKGKRPPSNPLGNGGYGDVGDTSTQVAKKMKVGGPLGNGGYGDTSTQVAKKMKVGGPLGNGGNGKRLG